VGELINREILTVARYIRERQVVQRDTIAIIARVAMDGEESTRASKDEEAKREREREEKRRGE